MHSISLTDHWGRAVEITQDERGFVYALGGMEVVRATRNDAAALDLISMHDAPPKPAAPEQETS